MHPPTDSQPGAPGRSTHVQVLTAEVRTLVVGSRQVTMSVYNQLDDVAPAEIEPFGRVNPKDTRPDMIYVVGRHVITGALVSSDVPRVPRYLVERPHSPEADGFAWLRVAVGKHVRWRPWHPDIERDEQKKRLEQIAAQWSELPLIVLAGLR